MYVGDQPHAPTALPLGKTQYPLFRRLGAPQGRSGRVRKISPPTGIRSPDRPARSESLYRLSFPCPPRATLSTINTTWTGPGKNPDIRGERLPNGGKAEIHPTRTNTHLSFQAVVFTAGYTVTPVGRVAQSV